MFEAAIQKAVDDYIEMEKSHAIISAMHNGVITRISIESDGWRVDTPITFATAPTLKEAIEKATNVR